MCRCCQECWEDFKWNCFEEKFCYDESIANYNPDEDETYMASLKNGNALGCSDNNNLKVPISSQPVRGSNSTLMSTGKIHEEDYRRETQTNVPMLGPEILAVFANSQIFQDHQPTKMNRISTKSNLAGIHSPGKDSMPPSTPRGDTDSAQDRLLKRLEGTLAQDVTDTTKSSKTDTSPTGSGTGSDKADGTPEKRITFTITDSSPDGSATPTPKKFDSIAEEEADTNVMAATSDHSNDEVILRPRPLERLQHLMPHTATIAGKTTISGLTSPRKLKRSATSVPHFHVRSAASETDIFSITGSTGKISMTPEVPSISFSNLPKNYEDTPTIEKYRVSQSLYSIQTANAARAGQDDYSMPRYFRRSAMMASQSTEMLAGSSTASMTSSKEDVPRPEKEKSKRLQRIRGNLPPLLIHSVSFRKNRDEGKQVD